MEARGDKTSVSRLKPGEFPPLITTPPLSAPHKLTIIVLHGRGFNAEKFHPPLLASLFSNSSVSFQQSLPHARFVFPTAPLARATKYRRSLIHQWYEGTGDWEPEARGDMRPSVEHIHKILKDEIEMLDGDAGRVVLMGFSQGGAMALVSWLLWQGQSLGAVVIMSGFMPLAETLMVENEDGDTSDDGMFETEEDIRTPLQKAIDELREEAELDSEPPAKSFPFIKTPVFMGHGQKDKDVEFCHGQQAANCLERMGIEVELKTYPDMAHWYCPEELGDISKFITQQVGI
ncbi:Alpha/Beta hydrolase protein [Fusarium flagelliforme]|uniref:Alpha/Beta hydrolase protein n=1 Tax=Fusarium flagelliforme TaxID=2675880 RepID=UPI001E8D25C3|nr:Alpha/Beta hydrolase protein [Fusarium flagelliforme]KAH7197824.1 Alpha/Beta hydrolase protein [Fusarium flagelliforme]